MTIEEIQESLPNGFHDSTIIGVRLNYAKRTADIDMEICFSDPDEDAEDYRTATLSISQLLYFVIEPPDSRYPFHAGRPLLVDGGSTEVDQSSTQLPKPLPAGAFTYWFFVQDWNSFIHLGALSAEINVI